MRARTGAVVVLVLAVVGGIVRQLTRGTPKGEAAAATSGPAPAAVDERPASADVTPVREIAVSEEPPKAVEPATETSATPFATEPGLLSGTLTVLDLAGSELANVEGSFLILAWQKDFAKHVKVDVHEGRWTARVEGLEELEALGVDGVSVGGRRAVTEPELRRVPVPADRRLDIRARLTASTILRVTDAASGADLDRVSLVRCASGVGDEPHPGIAFEHRILKSDLRSPIDYASLGEGEQTWSTRQLHVGAEGFAWRRATFDLDAGGEVLIALERGGELELTVRGADPAARARLRLRLAHKEQPLLDDWLPKDAAKTITGLVPGAYSIRAEVGEWFAKPVLLGQTEVGVRVGERARADLVLGTAPTPETAAMGGVVYVPKEWKLERALVVLELLDSPLAGFEQHQSLPLKAIESERAGFDAFRWSKSRMQVGRYELGTFKPPYSIVVELPAAGRSDLELVVPPPYELRVFVVDDATGDSVASERLMWNPKRPEGVEGGALENAEHDTAGGFFVVRAPKCEIDLRLWANEYQPRQGSVDLRTGLREHTLRVQRACGIVFELVDGETLLAFPDDWHAQLETVSGHGKQTQSQYSNLERKYLVSEPGTYAIDPPKLPGYVQAPRQTVEVFAGQFTRLRVALEREHP